jgi:hypothetical protein
VALLTGRNVDRNTGQSCHEWFVNSSKLERSSFTKMTKMANFGESCQQFTVKGGVARLHVSQLAGKKTKRSPMVTDFCCMTPLIWVLEASVARESSAYGEGCWSGTAAARGRCILERLPCLVSPLQRFWPPPAGDQLRGATLMRNLAKNGSKNSPC